MVFHLRNNEPTRLQTLYFVIIFWKFLKFRKVSKNILHLLPMYSDL